MMRWALLASLLVFSCTPRVYAVEPGEPLDEMPLSVRGRYTDPGSSYATEFDVLFVWQHPAPAFSEFAGCSGGGVYVTSIDPWRTAYLWHTGTNWVVGEHDGDTFTRLGSAPEGFSLLGRQFAVADPFVIPIFRPLEVDYGFSWDWRRQLRHVIYGFLFGFTSQFCCEVLGYVFKGTQREVRLMME